MQQGGQNPNPDASRQDFTQLTAGGTPVVGEFSEGDVIGGSYRVLSWIGAGGMGNVYKVAHTMMGTEYALKTLSADKVTEVAWRRFQNEAQAIARMNHPNIVTIYNMALHEGRLPFYVMDILHGNTMLDYLRDFGPMPVPMAIDLFIEIAAGLGYAHKKGIVHRDVKPPNIVLLANPDASARVKVVDFGIAKLSGVKDPQNQFLTTVGEVCGSPYYMSPEQTAGQRIDARSDIYSLGCTLFEMLTGKPPLRGSSAVETMMMHQTTQPPTLKEVTGGQEFPEMLETLIATLLAKAPMDRYQTMERVGQDLALIKGGQQAQISPFATSNLSPENASLNSATTAGAMTQAGLRKTSANFKNENDYNNDHGDHNDDSDNGQGNLLKIIAAGAALVISLGGAGAFYLWQSSQKPAPSKAAKTQTVGAASASVAMGPGDIHLLTKVAPETTGKMTDGQEDQTLDTKPTTSLKDKGPYSTIITEHGHPAKLFNFPTDFILGQIGIGMEGLVPAQGPLKFSVGERLKFAPNPILAKYPQYYKRFRPFELYAIVIDTGKDEDQKILEDQLKYVVQLEGLTEVHFDGLKALTPDMVQMLERVPNLKELRCSGKHFKAESMLQLKDLRKLETIGCSTDKNIDALLVGLKGDHALRSLWLENAPITIKGIDALAAMPNLKGLSIEKTKMDDAAFRKVCELKISGLILDGTPLNISRILALQKMHLQDLSVSARDFVGVRKESILQAMPGTRVIVNNDFSGSIYAAPNSN